MLHELSVIILVMSALFIVNVIACAYALGRMHAWLKQQGEPFGADPNIQRRLTGL